MNNYEKLNLYPHNIKTCEKVREAFESGQDIVSILKATGTGKSYIGLNLALEHKNEKIIWLVPTLAIKEHIETIINNNPNLSMQKDFPNLEIRTYSSLTYMEDYEIENLDCDLLIIDELHHIGAPVWGEKVNYLIDTHEDMKTFGMSAYSVRDRGTAYERDMTNPETEEIFSDTVVDRYDLYDAVIDGVLPVPFTKSILTEDSSLIEFLEDVKKLKRIQGKSIEHEIDELLDFVKKTIHKQNPVKKIIQETVEPTGKYIYFCPVHFDIGANDMNTIANNVVNYIKEKYPDKKIVVYQTTSSMSDHGKYNRDCFYHDLDLNGEDVSNTIRIMFAKNQYNEGVHAPNVDGVFLGRETGSDIVALEQIGRALSVKENIEEQREEYNLLSLETLKEIATLRGISFEYDIPKEYLIELLLAPRIIDLAGNIEFLEELETNLKDRVRERKKQGNISPEVRKRLELLEDFSPYTFLSQQKEVIKALLNIKNQLAQSTWDEYYSLSHAYYIHYGHSEIPLPFKTKNGYEYDKTGVTLGRWCFKQRQRHKSLSEERRKKLEQICFRFESNFNEIQWERKYQLALVYYNHHGHSKIPGSFKTNNGIDYDNKGVALGRWCKKQRARQKKLSEERRKKLEKIEFRFEVLNQEEYWNKMYQLALIYYNHHGHSEIPKHFKTVNGYERDEAGVSLGTWYNSQRKNKLDEEKRKKLEQINFRFENKNNILPWEKWYALAQAYYNHHGHSEIPRNFKTYNGIDYDEDGRTIGEWCTRQRQHQKKLDEESRKKLELIGFRFITKKDNEEQKKQLCITYGIDYEKYVFLQQISYQELYAKIMFLIEHNYSLVTEGNLHEIFTMSNENMTLKYMISKEDMITNYYINRKGKNV